MAHVRQRVACDFLLLERGDQVLLLLGLPFVELGNGVLGKLLLELHEGFLQVVKLLLLEADLVSQEVAFLLVQLCLHLGRG